ncbi:hypothetical protein V5O48_013541 [Marasmius crinis-equi]|uniref:Uncharacterized protein n=1 Tax=Marasmius crinis-equi TaxID=585013 RepID=A0ABR3EZW4_9AGAR
MPPVAGYPKDIPAVLKLFETLSSISVDDHARICTQVSSSRSLPNGKYPSPAHSVAHHFTNDPHGYAFTYVVEKGVGKRMPSYGSIIEGIHCQPGWVLDKATPTMNEGKHHGGVRYLLQNSAISGGLYVSRLVAKQQNFREGDRRRRLVLIAYIFQKIEIWPLHLPPPQITWPAQAHPLFRLRPPTRNTPKLAVDEDGDVDLDLHSITSDPNRRSASPSPSNRTAMANEKQLGESTQAKATGAPQLPDHQDAPHSSFTIPPTAPTASSSNDRRAANQDLPRPVQGLSNTNTVALNDVILAALANGNAVNLQHTFNFYINSNPNPS